MDGIVLTVEFGIGDEIAWSGCKPRQHILSTSAELTGS
jgi:hypothetical protein